ncbi:MAG: C39 family peptidase [Rubrivivax sp.]
MTTTLADPAALQPDTATLEHWLDQGLYLRVHPHVDCLAASERAVDRLQAVRALRYLGADREGDALLLRTGRRFVDDGAAVAALWRGVLSRRGPWLAGRVMERHPMPADADAVALAEAESARMRRAAALRDFDAMREHRATVRRIDDRQPWLWIEWAYCCLDADRPSEAAEAAAEALALQPGFRAALMLQASLHELAGRTDEACALLQQALAERECAAFGQQLWPLLMEAGDVAGAAAVLDRMEALWPRADAGSRGWLAARRADVASRGADHAATRAAAAAVPGTGFYSRLAERLAAPDDRAAVPAAPWRTMLPVPFVRQNWLTCAPATLTALAAFWGRPVDHLELAEAICYDGTSHASERQWALDAGWHVREFTLDAATAEALVAAGVPFTVTTSETASAHLQAVIGVDRLRQTLIVRDPTEPSAVEFEMAPFFERYRATGPRAMLLLPPEQLSRLHGITLPDAEAWDDHFAVMAALTRHDRHAAQAVVARAAAARPGHGLQLRTQRALAMYDGDEPAILAATEALLAQFPDDGHLRLSKASSLWTIGGRDEHRAWLAACCEGPWPEPLFRVRLADRTLEDERALPQAAFLLRRVLWRTGTMAEAWSGWADLTWRRGDKATALAHYRAASTLRDTSENDAGAYARALRFSGDAVGALQHLQRRVERLGAQSGEPAQTLFEEFEAQDRAAEGFEALAAARARRPADGMLAVFSAEALIRYGRTAEAQAVLDGVAEGTAAQGALLRARSRLAEAGGDFATALALARQAVALWPLNLELHRLLVRQVDRLHGREAVITELQSALQRFPRFVGLQRLLYDWLPRGDARELAQLDALAALHPGDAWTQRERAVVLENARRFDEALAAAQQAVAIAPRHAASHAVLGSVHLARDGYDTARPHLERALALDVDHEYALRTLVSAAPDAARARSALALIEQELARQPSLGDVLLTWQAWAADHLDHDALLAAARALQAARPRLWQGWVAVARTLAAGSADELAQAEQLMAEAGREFPTVAGVALDHALRLSQLQRRGEARAVMERALVLAPAWNRAVRLMVDLIDETHDDWPLAERVLQRALALAPSDADLRGLHAWVQEQAGRPAEALATLQEALAQDPEPEWMYALP